MIEDHSDADDDQHLPPKFKLNQRVFCPENSSLYEGAIKKTSYKGTVKGWNYLVHFLGWSKRHDKWVEERLLSKPTEELRNRQAAQAAQEKEAKRIKDATKLALLEKKRKKRDEAAVAAGGDPNRGAKRRFDDSDRPSNNVWEDYCELPFTLKTILIDERERVMRMNNVNHTSNAGVDTDFEPGQWRPPRDVHNLPASVTIKTVLHHYVKMKKKEAADEISVIDEEDVVKAKNFVESLSQLFEEALPVCLLYHPERAQYMSISADPLLKPLRKTEIYGCEFLLRLLVRLPTILAAQLHDEEREMGQHLQDLIVLLQKNRQSCFKAKFREPKRPEELNDFEKAICGDIVPTTTTVPMEDA